MFDAYRTGEVLEGHLPLVLDGVVDGLAVDARDAAVLALAAVDDIQVIGEEWAGRSPAWVKAEAEGKVHGLGNIVKGATEGWWVPEFVIKGDPEKASSRWRRT